MEELSKQLSTELNKPITIHEVNGYWFQYRTPRFLLTNINYNESHLFIDSHLIQLYCNSKCDITIIIQMYKQTNEYKNSLDNEFNLDCAVTTFYDDDNVIDEVQIYISVGVSDYIKPVYAKTYLECYEKINKIITLKNELLSKYGTIKESNTRFVLDIDNDTNTLEFSLYEGDEDILAEEEDMIFRITVSTNKFLIHEVYNQLKNYFNSFIEKYDNDEFFRDRYMNSSIYIDMSYKDNNSNIDVEIPRYDSSITINSESKNIDFSVITEIYTEVINYIESCYCKIGSKNAISDVIVIYDSNKLVNICATYDKSNYHIEFQKKKLEANNYIEFTEKLEVIIFEEKKLLEEYKLKKVVEDRLKKELEKQKLEKQKLEEEKLLKQEKLAIELSKFLKEDVIVEDINNESFIISGEDINKKFKIKIVYFNYETKPLNSPLIRDIYFPDIPDIFPNIPNTTIRRIYNEVKNYRNINLKPEVIHYIDTHYTQTNVITFTTNITIKYDDCIFTGNNYIECNKKILEYVNMNELKLKEQESIKLKLKYGDKTVLTESYHVPTSCVNLVISNVDTEHIDLLDIIHNYPGNKIVNGFIKQTNYANHIKYSNSFRDKPIFKISVLNCPNLKIINNIIDFENNCNLYIGNCPKLEFIQNYNNFSEIYIQNYRVKVITE